MMDALNLDNPIEAHHVQDIQKAGKEVRRVMRHIAKPPILILSALLTPEKRAYMKRFGSRPKKKSGHDRP